MNSNYCNHRSMLDDDEDDEDIATVYSKEYSHMAAMFNSRSPGALTSPTLPIQNVVKSDMKIVGVDQNPAPLSPPAVIDTSRGAPKATSRIIQPLDMDLEWTTYRTAVNPNLLIPPTPKVAPQSESNPPAPKRAHQPVPSPSVATEPPMGDSAATMVKQQRGGCNRRWIVVLLLAGIFLTALVLAVGLSVLHQQAQQQSRTSSAATTTDTSPTESATIAPIDLLSNRPATDDAANEPVAEDKEDEPVMDEPVVDEPVVEDNDTSEESPTGNDDPDTNQPPTTKKGPTPVSPPVRTFLPTPEPPTGAPTSVEFVRPLYDTKRVVVTLIGNTPYSDEQEMNLLDQLTAIDSGEVDFVVHMGNLRDSNGQRRCKLDDIASAAETLQQSTVPVFVLLGDNDWLNCANDNEALSSWEETFVSFQQQYWSTRTGEFAMITSHIAPRPTSFAMEYNEILWVGLTLPGSVDMESADDWSNRLQAEFNWTESVVRDYERRMQPHTGRVVLMGHADPNDGNNNHHVYFDQLSNFVSFDLQNRLPIVYVNGNGESWSLESGFFNQPAFAHLVVPTSQSPLPTMTITANGDLVDPPEAFAYDSPDESNGDETPVVSEQSENDPPGQPGPTDDMADDDQSDDTV